MEKYTNNDILKTIKIIILLFLTLSCNNRTPKRNFQVDIDYRLNSEKMHFDVNMLNSIMFYCIGNINSDFQIEKRNFNFTEDIKYIVKSENDSDIVELFYNKSDTLFTNFYFKVDSVNLNILETLNVHNDSIFLLPDEECLEMAQNFKIRLSAVIEYINFDTDTIWISNNGLIEYKDYFVYNTKFVSFINENLPDNLLGGILSVESVERNFVFKCPARAESSNL